MNAVDRGPVVTGVVEHGKGLGHTLGFPTANIRPDGQTHRENGVYAALIWLEGEPLPRPCMINQGSHPTAPEGKPTVEAHIMGFEGDIYGRPVRVEYLRFLRPERRFDSPDALKAQIARDCAAALA